MLKSIRGVLAASLLAGTALAATPALADPLVGADGMDGFTISGNAAIVSQYRFRGVDLSGGDAAIQGGIDISHSSGFYVGTWGSSLDEQTVGYGHTEVDLYGGWTGNITSGVTADVGVIYYTYPNHPAGNYDYIEVYGSLGATVGPVEAKVGVAYAPKQNSLCCTSAGKNDDNFYVYAEASVAIPKTPVTINGHVGYTDGFLTFTNNSKAWDYSVGADFALTEHVSAGIAYVGAEGDYVPGDYRFTRGAAVGNVTISF